MKVPVIDKSNASKIFLDAVIREREKLDKMVFAVNAGTLSISITFISTSDQIFLHTWLLFLSWVSLIIGLISFLLAYQFAISHFSKCCKSIKENSYYENKDASKTLADVSNWITLIVTIIGIILFGIFGYSNL